MNNSREKVNMKYVSSLGLRNLFQQRMVFFLLLSTLGNKFDPTRGTLPSGLKQGTAARSNQNS